MQQMGEMQRFYCHKCGESFWGDLVVHVMNCHPEIVKEFVEENIEAEGS